MSNCVKIHLIDFDLCCEHKMG